jgi:hypothetical protein
MSQPYLKRLSDDRVWRVRELSDLRVLHEKASSKRERETTSRSIVVLSYAHWEGYCSKCAGIYIDFLEEKKVSYSALPPGMFLGAMSSALDSYRDKADNLSSRKNLVEAFQKVNGSVIERFDRRVILPRSNLNFPRLEFIHKIIGAELEPFQRHRLKIDKELVAWRHLVAHGEMFVLDESKADSHTKLCEELMFLTKDAFEDAILCH